MKLIIATHNDHKLKEFKQILKDTNIELVSLKDLKDFDEIVENGSTFLENALIKAKNISLKYNLPVIADDSGVSIEALDNRPGIHSARYSGKGDLENNLKVLKELENIENRKATFNCVIVVYYPDGNYHHFEGIWPGTIAHEMRGENGFGYDPIFVPDGYNLTVSELGEELKSQISHRAKALQLFMKHYTI